jgi:hypothetical protein
LGGGSQKTKNSSSPQHITHYQQEGVVQSSTRAKTTQTEDQKEPEKGNIQSTIQRTTDTPKGSLAAAPFETKTKF